MGNQDETKKKRKNIFNDLPVAPDPPEKRINKLTPISEYKTKADILDRDIFSDPDMRRRLKLDGNPGRIKEYPDRRYDEDRYYSNPDRIKIVESTGGEGVGPSEETTKEFLEKMPKGKKSILKKQAKKK